MNMSFSLLALGVRAGDEGSARAIYFSYCAQGAAELARVIERSERNAGITSPEDYRPALAGDRCAEGISASTTLCFDLTSS